MHNRVKEIMETANFIKDIMNNKENEARAFPRCLGNNIIKFGRFKWR